MTQTNAAAQANGLAYEEARRFYRAEGLTLVNRPDETDGAPAARVDLAKSGLIAVEIPGSQFYWQTSLEVPCGALHALGALDGVPAMQHGAGVTLLYAAPGLPENAPRRLKLDVSMGPASACYRPHPDDRNPALPCAGSPQKWVTLCAPPAAPAVLTEIAAGLAGDTTATDREVVKWLNAMYSPSGPTGLHGFVKRAKGDPVVGLSRTEVHDALMRCTGWDAADFSLERLSKCADAANITKHKTRSGFVWLVQRRVDVPLRAPNGVDASRVDGVLLELARSLHISREHDPVRVKQRAKEQAAAAQRAEGARVNRERFGDHVEEALAVVRRRETHDGLEGMFHEHLERWERTRRQTCQGLGLEYVPLVFSQSVPAWWATLPPETPHDARHRWLVRTFAQPKAEVA